jgi:hypothetical protein
MLQGPIIHQRPHENPALRYVGYGEHKLVYFEPHTTRTKELTPRTRTPYRSPYSIRAVSCVLHCSIHYSLPRHDPYEYGYTYDIPCTYVCTDRIVLLPLLLWWWLWLWRRMRFMRCFIVIATAGPWLFGSRWQWHAVSQFTSPSLSRSLSLSLSRRCLHSPIIVVVAAAVIAIIIIVIIVIIVIIRLNSTHVSTNVHRWYI